MYRGRPDLMSQGRPELTSQERPSRTFRRRLKDVMGRLLYVLSYFVLLNSMLYLETYYEPIQASKMEYFCRYSYRLLAVNYFCKKAAWQTFNLVLNMLLILSSIIIWHTYGSIADNRFSGLVNNSHVFFILNIIIIFFLYSR